MEKQLINIEKLKEELEELGKYLVSRNLNIIEQKFLLSDMIDMIEQIHTEKFLEERRKNLK